MTTPLMREMVKLAFDAGIDPTELHWFDASGALDIDTVADSNVLLNNPFPFFKNIVLWRGKTLRYESYDVILIACGNSVNDEEGVVLKMWRGPTNTKPQSLPSILCCVSKNGNLSYAPADGNISDIDADIAQATIVICIKWLEGLSQTINSQQPFIKKSFTNDRKLKAKKMPLYEWRTVTIQPTKPKREHLGGTHASPRQHDRRGHWRVMKKSQKRVWVKDCKVGKASNGVVFHDYKVINPQQENNNADNT